MRRTTSFSIIFVAIIGLIGSVGCGETIDSSSVDTSEIYADLQAKDDGSGATIEVRLREGGQDSNTYLELGDGDELTVYVDGASYTPEKSGALGTTFYETTVDGASSGSEVRVELTRQEGTDATSSMAVLPNTFTIEDPDPSDHYSRTNNWNDVSVRLTNSPEYGADTVQRLEVENASCLKNGYEEEFSGDSTYIPQEELVHHIEDEPESCSVDVTVTRTRTNGVDSSFGGGAFEAIQERDTSFESDP